MYPKRDQIVLGVGDETGNETITITGQGLSLINRGSSDIVVAVHALTFSVPVGTVYEASFPQFESFSVTASGAWSYEVTT